MVGISRSGHIKANGKIEQYANGGDPYLGVHRWRQQILAHEVIALTARNNACHSVRGPLLSLREARDKRNKAKKRLRESRKPDAEKLNLEIIPFLNHILSVEGYDNALHACMMKAASIWKWNKKQHFCD